MDENTPCNPLSQYGIAKNALRQSLLLLTQNSDVKIYWLRAYYILGDDRRNSSIFTKLLQAVEDGKEDELVEAARAVAAKVEPEAEFKVLR